jgi:hypothetical protein
MKWETRVKRVIFATTTVLRAFLQELEENKVDGKKVIKMWRNENFDLKVLIMIKLNLNVNLRVYK